jgi:2,3-diketo-5-methylthio-1-phosphopentane phosphatase
MDLPRVYLLDVEGTVAPISLVTEQLFPYARIHFSEFILRNLRDDPAIRADLVLLWEENQAETDPTSPRLPDVHSTGFKVPDSGVPGGTTVPAPANTVEAVAIFPRPRPLEFPGLYYPQFLLVAMMYINWLMDRDRKSTALKSLQGKIWKAGFESGELKGTLFADVPEALARWAERAQVAIYSSGSVEAQRLLFRHSIFGDLTSLIAGYFDTRTGAKQASASYAAIAAATGVAPEGVRFFSDVVRELDAAREAGLQTRLVVREGNAPIEDAHGHAAVESFALL